MRFDTLIQQPTPSSLTNQPKIEVMTDPYRASIMVRVKRSGQNIDYHRTNRSSAEIFDFPQAELHEIFASTKDFAIVNKNKKILDLGCGGGACAQDLQRYGLNITGVDLFLDHQQKSKNVQLGDAFALTFQSGSFDLVYSVWSVFTYEPLQRIHFLLKEAFRVLAPQGSLLISAVDESRTRIIQQWCEQNAIVIFRAPLSGALHLIK